jgi:hypothetical protein
MSHLAIPTFFYPDHALNNLISTNNWPTLNVDDDMTLDFFLIFWQIFFWPTPGAHNP